MEGAPMATQVQYEDGNVYTLHRIDPGNIDLKKFDEIYELYKRCYPLETEQVPKEDFLGYLRAGDARNQEMWVYLEDQNGKVAGASNFDVFAGNKAAGVDGTIHSTFTFVDPEHRGQNLMGTLTEGRENAAKEFIMDTLLGHMDQSAREFIKASGTRIADPNNINIVTIIEQNSPLLMTPAQIIADPMDVIHRRMIYAKRGFEQIDMRYIQPSLGVDDKGERIDACDVLDLCASGTNGQPVPKEALEEHFERWFKLSFPEGTHMPSLSAPQASLSEGAKELLPMASSLAVAGQNLPLMPNDRYQQLVGRLAQIS